MSNEPSANELYLAAIGERIMTWREALGISPHTLAAWSGLSVGYIRRVERGRANPTLTTLQRIARALGTTLPDLLDVDGEELGLAAQAARASGA